MLLMRGHTKARIGAELGIAEDTVRNLVRQAYERLGAHNRVQAAIALGMLGGER
jgi:DNA-binding NarL/FixJ family response regulator